MKRYSIGKALLTVSVLFFVGCGSSDLDAPENETVVGGEIVVSLDGNTIKSSLIAAGTPGIEDNTTVYGYKAYKIPYTTTDEEGNSVAVSGLMVVPTGVPDAVKQIGFSVVSDSHGTIFANSEAPTVVAATTNSPDGAPVIFSSLSAFVTLQADYIGFGDSLGHYHPFVLKKSLANATVDFIKAAQTFAEKNGIHLNGQLFVTGYSEGGYAAMAALQKIEYETSMNVQMAAPMAGPYDINVTAYSVLSEENLSVPSFMADVGYAYGKAYDEPIDSIINEPYASKLPTLLDGSKTREEIDAELSHTTTGADGLFNPLFVQDFFTNSANWFRQASLENNVNFWAPQTPVKLVHCIGDDVIDFKMSEWTYQTLLLSGASDVDLIPVEIAVTGDPATELRYGHADCAAVAYGITAHLFAEERKTTIGY